MGVWRIIRLEMNSELINEFMFKQEKVGHIQRIIKTIGGNINHIGNPFLIHHLRQTLLHSKHTCTPAIKVTIIGVKVTIQLNTGLKVTKVTVVINLKVTILKVSVVAVDRIIGHRVHTVV